MGLGGAKRWGKALKLSYRGEGEQAIKGKGNFFLGGGGGVGELTPSRHHGNSTLTEELAVPMTVDKDVVDRVP